MSRAIKADSPLYDAAGQIGNILMKAGIMTWDLEDKDWLKIKKEVATWLGWTNFFTIPISGEAAKYHDGNVILTGHNPATAYEAGQTGVPDWRRSWEAMGELVAELGERGIKCRFTNDTQSGWWHVDLRVRPMVVRSAAAGTAPEALLLAVHYHIQLEEMAK